MNRYQIIVSNIYKKFKIYKSPRDRLKETLSLTQKKYHRDFWALEDVSFSVKTGHTMGILGINGSGKSTLLKIICGYLMPTSGSIQAQGRIASILELGTGFNQDFTGKENVILYSGLMGLSRSQAMEKLPQIETFADIGDFFQRPIRLYSSGMTARLAFACTIHMEPDILIIDEALAVGDAAFKHKCMNRIRKLQEHGVTILFVSHDIGAVKSLCHEAMMLERGRKVMEGNAEDVANFYHATLARNEQEKILKKTEQKKDESNTCQKKEAGPVIGRTGTGEIRIDEVLITDVRGQLLKHVEFNQKVCISTTFTASTPCRPMVFGCLIRDCYGIDMMGTNTTVENIELPVLEQGESCTVQYLMNLPLAKGSYSITVALGHDPDRHFFYDWWDNACVFEMLPPKDRKLVNCKFHLPIDIKIRKNVR